MTRKQRYRQRLKLQAAIARTVNLLLDHQHKDQIPPDRTTATMAAELIVGLTTFARAAGVVVRGRGSEPDVDRIAKMLVARKRATSARYKRAYKRAIKLRDQATIDRLERWAEKNRPK